jgi:hypothetical protein
MAYERVNEEWPANTNAGRDLKPTADEATRAVKLLWRKWTKRPFPWTIRVTSGNRRTWIADRPKTFNVNPDERSGGWHEVVHSMSHLVAWKLHPGSKNHGAQHHWIEQEMVKHVVASGWLEGKLKRPEKPPVDKKAAKIANVALRIKRWETRRRRAETALRKLRQQQKGLLA